MEDKILISDFEEFYSAGGRFTPLISVNETGGIGVSAGFIRKYEIKSDKTEGVKLYYNKKTNSFGIKFCETKELGILKIKFAERGGAHINAKAFWVKFDIDFNKFKGKYTPTLVNTSNDKIYVVDLKESIKSEN